MPRWFLTPCDDCGGMHRSRREADQKHHGKRSAQPKSSGGRSGIHQGHHPRKGA